MNLLNIFIFFLIPIALILIQNLNVMKRDKMFKWRKVLDIVRYFSFYIFIIYLGSADSKKVYSNNILTLFSLIPPLATSIYSFILIFTQLVAFNKVKALNADLLYILVSLLIGLITSFSSIYFLLYTWNPSWFNIDGNFKAARLGFEFIYFTFSISITYSSNTITAVGVIPKLVVMIHVLLFYLFIGNTVISLISRIKLLPAKAAHK